MLNACICIYVYKYIYYESSTQIEYATVIKSKTTNVYYKTLLINRIEIHRINNESCGRIVYFTQFTFVSRMGESHQRSEKNCMLWHEVSGLSDGEQFQTYLVVRCDRYLDLSTKWTPLHTNRLYLDRRWLIVSSIRQT